MATSFVQYHRAPIRKLEWRPGWESMIEHGSELQVLLQAKGRGIESKPGHRSTVHLRASSSPPSQNRRGEVYLDHDDGNVVHGGWKRSLEAVRRP
ncbi:hypothetical protein PM082_023571 [Marasmius tenuissimus]|nr:hypothetical protein PM082_023571 [Marasmius tenuissimus]